MGFEKIESSADFQLLCKTMLELKNTEDCAHFLEDLCSIAEIVEMSKRMRAAEMLFHDHPYSEIVTKTGLSTATISRVKKCLRFGSDGYQKVLNALESKGENG